MSRWSRQLVRQINRNVVPWVDPFQPFSKSRDLTPSSSSFLPVCSSFFVLALPSLKAPIYNHANANGKGLRAIGYISFFPSSKAAIASDEEGTEAVHLIRAHLFGGRVLNRPGNLPPSCSAPQEFVWLVLASTYLEVQVHVGG